MHNDLFKKRHSITRWAIKHNSLFTANVDAQELLETMVALFVPEISHIDVYGLYVRNADGFLRDRMRRTYFRIPEGVNRYGEAKHEKVRTLAEYYSNCFLNLVNYDYDNEIRVRDKARMLGEPLRSCNQCGGHYLNSDLDIYQDVKGYEDTGICKGCLERTYRVCKGCQSLHHIREMRHNMYIEGNRYAVSVCAECARTFVRCTVCGRHAQPGTFKKVEGTALEVCTRCYDNIIQTCVKCGDKFNTIHRCDGWDGEMKLCDPCLMKTVPYHSYRFKPLKLDFQSVKGEQVTPNTLYLGLELEFEMDEMEHDRTDFSTLIKRRFDWDKYYIVHDGSLDYGLEVVLMPFTERWYHDQRDWLKSMYDFIIKQKATFVGKKVGFHVHTSLAAWEKSQIYKLVKFIYKGGFENCTEFSMIYGRPSNKFCQYNGGEYENALSVAKDKKNYDDGHHYNALNLSTGQTIEFRMFAGPATFEEMLMRIDFVLSCHQFTREYGFKDMNMNGYLKFLNRNPSQYFRILTQLRKGI